MTRKKVQSGILAGLIGLLVMVVVKHQAITDWTRLYAYTPPAAIMQLADDDTMTATARHLLYVNHPVLTNSTAFSQHCPGGSEKTVVLGCYLGPDRGIYVYAVPDSRLQGVEQVTAAHEMLHAAYRRLSASDRTKVDAMLEDYYAHDLTDQRIKDTIAAYKQSEPHDVVNEMHSVFGTEVSSLPAPLEQYYRRYFTDRAAVAGFTAQYQTEFTRRQSQVSADDTRLAALKQQIKYDQAQLNLQKNAIDAQTASLDQERADGQVSAYNNGIAAYNQAVDRYNGLLETTKNLINQYNDIVSQRNSVVLEEQQLTKELSGSSLVTK